MTNEEEEAEVQANALYRAAARGLEQIRRKPGKEEKMETTDEITQKTPTLEELEACYKTACAALADFEAGLSTMRQNVKDAKADVKDAKKALIKARLAAQKAELQKTL